MATIHTLVGYRLILIADGSVIQTIGPNYPPQPVPDRLVLPNGDIVASPSINSDYEGYMLVEWFDDIELPVQSTFDAETFILRFTHAEYADLRATTDIGIHMMWEIMLARNSIDVRSQRALFAKEHFVDEGILTQERADIIWDTDPPSMETVAPPTFAAAKPKTKAKAKKKKY